MLVKWLGHAAFYIETGGRRLVCDPFNAELGYPVQDLEADIVTTSHSHWDHNAVDAVKGTPRVINDTGHFTVNGIKISGTASYHDKTGGRERGPNIIYKIESEGLHLVHLGDLGHVLTPEQVEAVGSVDILLVPVGGKFTVDAREALEIVGQLNPKIVIPMHFNTEHLCFELGSVEAFTAQFDQVIHKGVLEIGPSELVEGIKVVVLDYLA